MKQTKLKERKNKQSNETKTKPQCPQDQNCSFVKRFMFRSFQFRPLKIVLCQKYIKLSFCQIINSRFGNSLIVNKVLVTVLRVSLKVVCEYPRGYASRSRGVHKMSNFADVLKFGVVKIPGLAYTIFKFVAEE